MEMENRNSTEVALLHYKEGLAAFTDKMPELVKQFNSFTEECFKEGALSQKTKQLIALGISIQTQDEYCIIYHTKAVSIKAVQNKKFLKRWV